MFEKVSRSLKYDSNFFFVHKHIIGERAKRARHSQVSSIENRGYIYYNIIYTRKMVPIMGGASS